MTNRVKVTCPHCNLPVTLDINAVGYDPQKETSHIDEYIQNRDEYNKALANNKCPDCEFKLITEGRCKVCINCGWQKCGG